MHFLQIVTLLESEIRTYNHEKGTIFYATDTKNVYLDGTSVNDRRPITKITVVCATQAEFQQLAPYIPLRVYIVLDSNLFYTTDELGVITQVTTYDEVITTIVSDPTRLTPKVLKQDGIPIAPITSSLAIVDSEGNSLTNEIEQMRILVNHMNKTHVYTTTPVVDDQKTFTINYPRHDYDINADPFLVMKDDVLVDKSTYAVTEDAKIIFNTGIKLNEKLTFIFNYHIVKALNELASGTVTIDSLDKEVQDLIKASVDPSKILFGDGESLSFKMQELEEIVSFINGSGTGGGGTTTSLSDYLVRIEDVINQFHGEYIVDDTENRLTFANIVTLVNDIKNKVETIETTIAGGLTTKTIVDVQRGTATIGMNNETVEIFFDRPVNPSKTLITLNGDSYYNETPYVWEVRANSFFVRQKVTVGNQDFISTFSWQAVEYY